MLMDGLINILLDAGAAERHGREISFTTAFGSYLVLCFGQNVTKAVILEDWRSALCGFSPSLELLSTEDIMSIVLLLDYHLSHAETWVAVQS